MVEGDESAPLDQIMKVSLLNLFRCFHTHRNPFDIAVTILNNRHSQYMHQESCNLMLISRGRKMVEVGRFSSLLKVTFQTTHN